MNSQVLVHHLLLPPDKGSASCEQLIGEYGKGVLVGSVNGFAIPLLWCHVGGGAPNGVAYAGSCTTELGYTKVGKEQVWMINIFQVSTDQEVGGFDVLMHNRVVVCILKCARRLADKMRNILR